MGLELDIVLQTVMAETKRVDTPEEFQLLLAKAKPVVAVVVRQAMEPGQAFSTTLIELRDLYVAAKEYEPRLTACNYSPERRMLYRDSIRLADTAYTWFSEGVRTGAYRVRTVEEVVEASRPWRARISAIGGHAFVFEPDIADQFADVNSTRTLGEEQTDLVDMNALIAQHEARLREYGLTDALIARGKVLYEEAMGRDLLGILGLRTKEDGITLRNQIITYSVMLAKELRAAGANACFDDPAACKRFEAASFHNALRRLRGPRGKRAEPGQPEPEPVEPRD